MRDEKVCPACGEPLVWKGNVLEGALACEHCPREESLYKETAVAIDWAATNTLDHTPRDLRKEAAEWDDLGLRPQPMVPERIGQEHVMTGGRRAGRTHAMILRALECAGSGNKVIILVPNFRAVDYVEDIIDRLGVPRARKDGFTPGCGTVIVRTLNTEPRAFGRDCKVFADHTVFESCKKDDLWRWSDYNEIKP